MAAYQVAFSDQSFYVLLIKLFWAKALRIIKFS